MIKNGSIYALISAFFLMITAGCNLDVWNSEDDRSISLVYTEWSEGMALTYLSKILLEEKMDYNVEIKLTDVESAYNEVATGNMDIFADAWLPLTQQHYYDKHQDDVDKLGIIYPEARTGFVVPEYSRLTKVEDLKNYGYPIVGIDSGAGVMSKSRAALDKYAPGRELLNLSEEKMVARLDDSIKRRKEVVVTGWEPHWMFARYDVRFLEDPDSVFGTREKIYAISRKNLEAAHPHAVRFFERMQFSESQLNQLVYSMRKYEDPLTGIREWIRKNEYIVNQWVKDLNKKRKKIM